MKVRATQDGHYAGYYRYGPLVAENGNFEGEVFEIRNEPYPVVDENGKSVLELNEKTGKPILDKQGNPVVKMVHDFSPVWMERVSDDLDVTYDHPPIEIPIQYRDIKKRGKNANGMFVPTPGAPGGANSTPVI